MSRNGDEFHCGLPDCRPAKIEVVKERFCGHIISSDIRDATKEEIDRAEALHLEGKCPHYLVHDVPGYLYDDRSCVTCGHSLGLI